MHWMDYHIHMAFMIHMSVLSKALNESSDPPSHHKVSQSERAPDRPIVLDIYLYLPGKYGHG